MGARYFQTRASDEEPRLVLFTGAVRSACGTASAAVGPSDCPGDRKVFLDLSFSMSCRTVWERRATSHKPM